jgi:hypothetical protein
MPTVDDTTPGLQCSWDGDAALMWQPARSAAGGNLAGALAGSWAGRSAGPSMVVREVVTPAGQQRVMCARIDPSALLQLGDGAADASPSLAWCLALRDQVDELVGRGRVVPTLAPGQRGRWYAHWQLAVDDLTALVDAFAPAMPPVCAAVQPADAATVVVSMATALADASARLRLRRSGWAAAVTDTRRPWARAVRAVTHALVGSPEVTHGGIDPIDDELEALATLFDRMAARANGEPVVGGRVRLALPDTPDAPWPVVLELVDLDDRSRWCSGAGIDALDPAALVLAGDVRHLPLLTDALARLRRRLTTTLPWLAEWLVDHAAELPVEQAALLLEAVDVLDEAGIELLAPIELVRRKPTVRGTASPPAGESAGRFGATALVEWQLVVDDAPIDEVTLARAAEAGTALMQVGGRWVRLDRADARRALDAVAEHRAEHSELDTLGLLRLAAELSLADTAADDAPVDDTLQAEGWLGDLLAGLPDTELADGDVPPGFTATLRPYQRRGLGWLQFLRRVGLGGCLADDMGLGKTPTTLAHLAALDGPHLVLCPLSVVRNWQQEASRFTPLARVLVLHGADRPRGAAMHAAVASADIVVSTYHVAARDIDELSSVAWSTVVLDEAQAVKNPHTHAAKAVRRLRADQRLALTGTPVENRLAELWAILDVVTPGLLGGEHTFRHRFAAPIEREHDEAAAAALRQLTAPFLLRRTKADKSLVPDLPDKVEQIAYAGLTREQAAMYQSVVDQLLADAEQAVGMKRRGLVLAALTRLKQICNHPAHALGDGSRLAGRSGKLTRFDELVTDLLDAGEQALVFTQFREMGELLVRHLHERFHLDVPFLHGGVARTGRDRMVQRFQAGEGSPLLLVSLKAGGTGLNLTAASRVVHYDRWWNPAVEDQATDRAWRIGQTQSVFVHKLVCQGTVEERIAQLIDDKRALANAVVGAAGETWLSELSTDELRSLVALDVHAARSL